MMRIKFSKAIVIVGVLLLAAPAAIGILLGDGEIHNIDYAESHLAVDYQQPGLQTTVNIIEMGYAGFLEAWEDSVINLHGGSIDFAACFDNSRFNAYSGDALMIHTFGNSRADIFGGSIQGLSVPENGIATIHGSDFAVNGESVGYVELSSIIGLGTAAHLTGTFHNGEPLDIMCDIYGNGQIFLVPEPATLLLVGFGGLMLRQRRRRFVCEYIS